MGLRIRRAQSKKFQFLAILVAVFALVAQPTISILRSVGVNAISLQPDMSEVKFKGSPKYVRENNAGDLAAQLITYSTTTDVNFYVDGNADAPIPGAYKGVSSAGYEEWRLKAPFAAGEHSITAQVKIGGEWYAASDSGMVYSLDTPWASYISPTSQNHLFRPGDNPLRLKIDDEFNQFETASFKLYHYDTDTKAFGDFVDSFMVKREQCDLRTAGHYLLCDINTAANWRELPAGSYAATLQTDTLANNGVRYSDQEYWSSSFTVDSTPPTVNSFKIESGTTVGKTLQVAAMAADDNEVESVNFYVTRPRSDGVCTGNEVKLAAYRSLAPDTDGYYRVAFDVSSDSFASGTYCVIAVARDGAMSNSVGAKLAFTVDHTAPTVTIRSTGSATPMASTDSISLAGNVHGSFESLTLLQDGVAVAATVDAASGEWSYAIPKDKVVEGAYEFTVFAKDVYGNKSAEENLTVMADPYLPGLSAATPQSPESTSVNLVVPSLFTTAATIPFTATPQPAEEPDDTAVLGTETAKSPAQSSDLPVVAATESGWKIFGIAWYWWALILAILTFGSWWTVASVRRRKATELA